MKKIIELKSACMGYGTNIVLKDLNLHITEGDFLGIIGPNGAGKTTLLKNIMGILKPQKGEVLYSKQLRFGYCMQRQQINVLFPFTVYEIVMMARAKLIGYFKKSSAIDKEKVFEVLDIVSIQELADTPFFNLSGGQKQRVLLARALCLEPDFLILDEPTIDLDIKAKKEVLELISHVHKTQQVTIALVSHEIQEVINHASKFIFLDHICKPEIIEKEKLDEPKLSELFKTEIKLISVNGKKVVL
ncbi:MAG: metal ABC transporter ATP-binding protein [bacterium]|nr:metal ABC transporter ATP-binding protein [bacterium]